MFVRKGCSLVPRPSYFVSGGGRRPGIHCLHMHEILNTITSHSFMANCTDVSVSKVSTDGLYYIHCCIATYEDSAV